jgi:hypothetical protein
MGWAGGSDVMTDIIRGIRPEIPDVYQRERVYKPILEALEGCDWDTVDEAMGIDPAFDRVVKAMHPGWDWDNYELPGG